MPGPEVRQPRSEGGERPPPLHFDGNSRSEGMMSTSFWQDGQAEISIQKARDLALLKPNARIFKARQFHRSCAGRIPAGGGKGNEVEKHFGFGLESRRFKSCHCACLYSL